MTVTRFFVGPLTPAQARHRLRSRRRYQEAAEVQDSRCVSFVTALRIAARESRWPYGLTLPPSPSDDPATAGRRSLKRAER